ncbi:MAG: arylsulfatase [Pseudomonadota bacterium]
MNKSVAASLILATVAIGYVALQKVNEAKEIGPSRQAVLAMTTESASKPASEPVAEQRSENPPNIVLILADDLGWRDVGYNYSEIRTPVIDQLASAGMKLNRFYVQPSCSPTRAALMTGKSPLRLGIVNPLTKNNPKGLPLEEKTIADRLREAGYQTALVGKWHLGARNLAYHPNARGFDHFYGHVTGGIGYYDKVHGGGYDWQRNGKTVREEGYTTHLIAKEAIKLIQERDQTRPLFLYAAFGAPHLPNEAPEETIQSYEHIENEHRRIHAAMVSELDTAIGDIHNALVAEGIENETLIWFMSDNGGLIVDNPARFLPDFLLTKLVESVLDIKANPTMIEFTRKNFTEGGSDNRPFKKGKGSIYEGGVRVPSFVHWPGQIENDAFNHLATVQDVAPTLLAAAGAEAAEASFDGRDLAAALETNTPPHPADYFTKVSVIRDSTAIYRYPYKLMNIDGELSLYDLERDPLERENLVDVERSIAAELAAQIESFPLGETFAIPTQEAVDDVDLFGGKEDREPWAERAYTLN